VEKEGWKERESEKVRNGSWVKSSAVQFPTLVISTVQQFLFSLFSSFFFLLLPLNSSFFLSHLLKLYYFN